MIWLASFDICGGDTFTDIEQRLDDACKFDTLLRKLAKNSGISEGDSSSIDSRVKYSPINLAQDLAEIEYNKWYKICAPNNKNIKLRKKRIDDIAKSCQRLLKEQLKYEIEIECGWYKNKEHLNLKGYDACKKVVWESKQSK